MFDRIRLGTMLFIGLAAVPFLGCGSSTEIDSIQVTPSTMTFGSAGLTGQLKATASIGHGNHPATTEDVTDLVTWSSGSVDVATVTSGANGGLVTSVGPGSIQITASINGFTGVVSASSTITVTGTTGTGPTNSDVTSISIIPGAQAVASPNETGQFIAIGTTASGATLNLTTKAIWSSSSPSVATVVINSGLVTAVGQGVSTISAIYTNADRTVATGVATFTVTNGVGSSPETYTAVTIIPGNQTVAGPGSTGQFIALGTSGKTGLQTNITDQVQWSSSATGVATITNTGLAQAVGQGTTAITAIATNTDNTVVTGAGTFTVSGASTQEITSLTIIPGSQTVTLPLVPSALPSTFFVVIGTNGSSALQQNLTNTVSWTSSNTAVATINTNGGGGTAGGVTLLSQGTTTITAQYNNPVSGVTPANVVTATATLTVSGEASEPLLSIAILPASESVAYPGQTSQLTAIGTFSEAPVTQNLTASTTYPVTWSSSNTSVATVCTAGSAPPCTAATDGLVTAVGQGTAAITAIASNTDKSVVTGVATFTVTNGTANQFTALTIIPSALSLSATGQPGQFIALATSGSSGLQQDVTNSPQLSWNSSLPTVATVCTLAVGTTPAFCPTTPGRAQGASVGNTNITAEFTNPAAGSIPANVVSATASVAVTNTPAAEPLLSVTLLPGTATTFNLEATAQFLAFGNFSTAPTLMDITNGFYHSGFPNSTCTAALAAANTVAIQAGTAAPNAQCSFIPVTWASLPFPFDFPINSAGAPGAFGGLITADASGTEDVTAVATNPDGTLVYSSPTGIFNCPYAAPTYGTTTTTINGVTTTSINYDDLLNPGTCNALTVSDGLLSTLTVFDASLVSTGLNQTNWLITAPSATGTPDVIHCGGPTEQALPGGSVCEATYPNGTVVTLTAPAESGVNFGGWSSNCAVTAPVTTAGPNSCTVVVGGGCSFNQQSQTYVCINPANISVGGIFN